MNKTINLDSLKNPGIVKMYTNFIKKFNAYFEPKFKHILTLGSPYWCKLGRDLIHSSSYYAL
jgi:hypothetical protein